MTTNDHVFVVFAIAPLPKRYRVTLHDGRVFECDSIAYWLSLGQKDVKLIEDRRAHSVDDKQDLR